MYSVGYRKFGKIINTGLQIGPSDFGVYVRGSVRVPIVI